MTGPAVTGASPATTTPDVATCDVCGNAYDKTMTITHRGRTGVYDSFECAIQDIAPVCAHCGCRVLGHGVESEGLVFCCAHCARTQGEQELVDRV